MIVDRAADTPDTDASSNLNDLPLPFKWPVLGFGLDVGDWSDNLVCFRNADQFRICGRHSYEDGRRVGMVLFDASGRSWEITSVRKLGTAGSMGKRILGWLLRSTAFNIEADITETRSVTFDELKSRVIGTIDANPSDWRDDEALCRRKRTVTRRARDARRAQRPCSPGADNGGADRERRGHRRRIARHPEVVRIRTAFPIGLNVHVLFLFADLSHGIIGRR